jgi:ligand-binding sensor domain-containing protein/signal transduction histidine kinase
MRSRVQRAVRLPGGATFRQSWLRRALALMAACLVAACGLSAFGTPASDAAQASAGHVSQVSNVDYTVDFWRVEQGLPHNTVNSLLQTRDGYLWVGTAAGLARFDGLAFTLIDVGAVPGLNPAVAGRITALLEDREGQLWVGTQGSGVVRISRSGATHFTVARGLADNAVTSLAEDAEGRVWIGTQGGLNKWENGRLEAFTSEVLPEGESVVALHAGRSGVLWITTRFEVFVLRKGHALPFRLEEMPQGRNADFVGVYEDRGGNLWSYGATFLLNVSQGRRFNYFRSLDPASSRVWTICEQGPGAFWIGTSGRGLFRFQNGRFDIAGAQDGLDQCDIRALHADREGNLWIGTSGSGLARLQTQQWRLFGRGDGLASTRLTALAADSANRLYVGTADNGLLQMKDQRVQPVLAGPPLDFASHIRSLCVDARGAVWVGTRGLGLFEVADGVCRSRYTTADGLSDDVVLALAAGPRECGSDAVWAGTLAGGLHRVGGGHSSPPGLATAPGGGQSRDHGTPSEAGRGECQECARSVASWSMADGLTGRAILSLLATADGGLFAGSEGGGLVRRAGARFVRVQTPGAAQARSVRCLFQDSAGRLWMGTEGAGVLCQTGPAAGGWVPLGPAQGLDAMFIGQIVEDPLGNFWFGSEKGIFRVPARDIQDLLKGQAASVTAHLFRREDGIENAFMEDWPAALAASDGALWFLTTGGLLFVDSSHIRLAPPPQVMIERVFVDGKNASAPALGSGGEQLRLGPRIRSLEFAFTAVNFSAPHPAAAGRFRHMLEGFDVDWVASDTARRAHYGPVPPGKYRFRVIAANAEGIWNETGATLSLVVAPPIWRAWWFLTLTGLALVAGVGTVVRYVSLRRLKAQLRLSEQRHAMERERSRIAQDMHDEIGSKLTRISFLSEAARYAGQSTPVGPQVEAIANTSRDLLQALDEIVWAVNPRNDNLEHLAGYLEQHAREYFQGTPLECVIIVPETLPKIPLTAELRHNVFLAFEEALSNALRHSGAALVRIEMALEPGAFEIRVTDNGAGFSARSDQGPGQDGLANMRDRLESVGGTCEVVSETARGVTVRLRFPLADAPATPAGSPESLYS